MEQRTTSSRYSVKIIQNSSMSNSKIKFLCSSYNIGTIINIVYQLLVVEDTYPYVSILHFVRDYSAIGATYTSSGSTALRAARERPHASILSLTPSRDIARYLTLAWGVHPVEVTVAVENADLMDVIDTAKRIAVAENFAKSGESVVIAAGMPFGISGTTNLLHVATID